jgi:hypothetical protein
MKIPFERTIANAYRFAFTNILTILGIGWFPFLLVALAGIGLIYALLPHLSDLLTASHDKWSHTQALASVSPFVGVVFVMAIVTIIASAMVNVGVMRKALGQHSGPYFIFFSLGAQVWRLIGAYLLLSILFWGIALFFVFGITGIAILLSKVSPGVQVLITTLISIAAICWGIYAAVRVAFFLPAVVVAENHIGIGRSWNLGRGNFWRIVGIYLVVTVPVAIANSTINQSLLQMALGPQLLPMAGWPRDPSHPAMTPTEMQHYFAVLVGALGRVWPYMVAVEMLYLILLTGLSAGAIAIAYNFVTGGPEIAPPSGSKKASA